MASVRIEKQYLRRGVKYIAGVDEVGRGALFGPVIAAAVMFSPCFFYSAFPAWAREVDDSKALSTAKRLKLKTLILQEAVAVGLGAASVREIDALNIHQASLLAMARAVSRLALPPEMVLVDGSGCYLKRIALPQVAISQGDKKCGSIAAASIVAKVFRDALITKLDKVFKGYDLCHNKGYGTKKHFEALRKLGPTPLHRRSFNLKS
ncbi:MAG: ribonuclease HII [Candidatus Aminicenantales bacterium]